MPFATSDVHLFIISRLALNVSAGTSTVEVRLTRGNASARAYIECQSIEAESGAQGCGGGFVVAVVVTAFASAIPVAAAAAVATVAVLLRVPAG